MEKFVAITCPTGTIGVKIKDIESIYEDDGCEDVPRTTGGLSIVTTNSIFRNVTKINDNRCCNVEDAVCEINEVIDCIHIY